MKSLKIIAILVVLGLIVWGLASVANKPMTTETGPIKIGMITPLTGDAASLGEFLKSVTDLTVNEINGSGGISGRPVSIIYEDSHCDTKGGLTAAQKLINVDKVKIIIGSDCSSGVLGALPITDQAGVLMVSAAATSPELTGKSQLFARTISDDSSQGRTLALGAIDKNWKKISVIQETTDFSLGIFRSFEDNYPTDKGTISKQEYPSATTDFRSILVKAKAQTPDALLLIPQSPGTAERLIKQLGELNWKVPLLLSDTYSGNPDQLMVYKTVLEGALTAERGADQTNAKYLTLAKNYHDKYGKDMIYAAYGQYQYDLIYLLKEGIGQFGENPTKIAAWLRTVKDWPGASGLVTIDQNGDRVGGHLLKVIKNGKTEIIGQ